MTPTEFDAAISAVHQVAVPLLVVASVVMTGAAVALREQERAGETPSVRVLLRRARRRLVRKPFEKSSAWWVEKHPKARPVTRHAARLAWSDPAGRWLTVRSWARVVRWGAGRDMAALRSWCARQVAAATDVRYGQLRLGGVA